jgi:hypothetical protein
MCQLQQVQIKIDKEITEYLTGLNRGCYFLFRSHLSKALGMTDS